jgi:hypothetical protein
MGQPRGDLTRAQDADDRPLPDRVPSKPVSIAGILGRLVVALCVLAAIAGVGVDIANVVTRPRPEAAGIPGDTAATPLKSNMAKSN